MNDMKCTNELDTLLDGQQTLGNLVRGEESATWEGEGTPSGALGFAHQLQRTKLFRVVGVEDVVGRLSNSGYPKRRGRRTVGVVIVRSRFSGRSCGGEVLEVVLEVRKQDGPVDLDEVIGEGEERSAEHILRGQLNLGDISSRRRQMTEEGRRRRLRLPSSARGGRRGLWERSELPPRLHIGN